MWKKTNPSKPSIESVGHVPTPESANQSGERAVIGASILVKGDLAGEEDLIIQGRIEGKIQLSGNKLTVGQKGRVKADIYAKEICIEGEVNGNLFGEEKVTVRKSGSVKGNMISPRVSLEDGATFKGSIDMGVKPSSASSSVPVSKTTPGPKQSSKPTITVPSSGKKRTSSPKTAEMPLGRGR